MAILTTTFVPSVPALSWPGLALWAAALAAVGFQLSRRR